MSNAYLCISQVDMTFAGPNGGHPVLKGIDLHVQRGEYIALIGHSGCGKSTVLNIVAGLLKATSGGVIVDNREVNAPGPDRAVVFQNHSLLPWLTWRSRWTRSSATRAAPPNARTGSCTTWRW
jgi:nitrate/nitrite transport system ATP-binding protein